MKLAVAALLVVSACGSKKAEPKPAPAADAAPAKPVDPGPSAAALAIADARSTQCVVNRIGSGMNFPITLLAHVSPAPIPEALSIAVARMTPAHEGPRPQEGLAVMLATRGELRVARALAADMLDKPPALRVLLGEAVTDDELTIAQIPALVIAKQQRRAELVLAPELARPDGEVDGMRLGEALGALGKTGELRDRIARATPKLAAALAVGWLHGVVLTDAAIDDAAAAVIAALTGLPPGDAAVGLLVMIVLPEANARGHRPALLDVRAAVVKLGPATFESLTMLHQIQLIAGSDDAELETIEAAMHERDRLHAQVRRTIYRSPPDRALAALASSPPKQHVELSQDLWLRHALAGMDPALEPRVAEAVCGPCLIDRAPGASIRVTDQTQVPSKEALAAAVPCVETLTDGEPRALVLELTPTGQAATAIAIAGAALDAGFDEVLLAGLDGSACRLRRGPASSHDQVQLSVLLEADTTWFVHSLINEQQQIGRDDLAVVKGVVDQLGAASYFADRKDAELAAAPGVPADALLAMRPLCERFPQLRLVPPDALTTTPTL